MRVKIETHNIPEIRKKLQKFPKAARGQITSALLKWGHLIEADGKRFVRVKTGRLRSSITTEKINWNEVHTGTNVSYGPDVEYGTAPHVIVPKTRKVLKFTKDGEDIYAKRVYHPGNKPYPYLRPATDKNRAMGRQLVTSEVKKVLPK